MNTLLGDRLASCWSLTLEKPMITHSDRTTYQTIANAHHNNITWGKQSYHSWQDLPNFQDHGCDPPTWDLTVQILHWWYST